MDISSQEIEAIVKQVLAGMGGAQTSAAPAAYTAAPGGAAGDRGVFENVDDAVEAAWKAQRDWAANYKIEDRQRIIEAIRRCARAHVEEWCHKIVEETGMGRYEDKVEKHLAVINKTPGPECLTTEAKSGDAGLMLEEYAPFGVICSITPTTNPTETIINNTISMIAGGNTVVFNVHPRAKRVSADCLQALNTAIIEAGGPANLITMTREPTMENVDKMAANPKIRLMAGTGGMGMVNGLLHELQKQGAYLLNKAQTEQLVNIVLQPKKGGGHEVNKKWVGKDAARILETIGVHVPDTCRLAICEVPADHPFVLVEQMMPVLPIVRCQSFEQAVEDAVVAEHGNRHTASIFSKDVDHMTRFARVIETTIYVKNSATKAGVGIGGEGHCTMTIAGPTGEGITCAKSFCRRRRCMLAEGGLRII